MVKLLAFISGLLIGNSIVLGFFPRYEQPKDIRIQIITGVIGFLLIILLILFLI